MGARPMNFINKLQHSWKKSNSLVCVGLDPLLEKIPIHLREKKNPIFEFNKSIIDATAEHVCAYKPQVAYFSSQKAEDALEETIAYIHKAYSHIPVILDAKRSDFDLTAKQYAIEAFDRYKADALTAVPFQGTDAIKPYLERADKGIILVCKTSNPSSAELQNLKIDGQPLYRIIANKAATDWNYNNNVSLVVGATNPSELREIRNLIGSMPILIPGVGAQGGSIETSIIHGKDSFGTGVIVSSSRSVLYASDQEDFAKKALDVVLKMKTEINQYRYPNLKVDC